MTWLAGFERRSLPRQPAGGRYDDTARPKLGWHTWESTSWASAEAAFAKYPPHLAVFPPWPGLERHVGRLQYVPLDRHAYAFAGSESDDEYVIQVEVAGFAEQMRHAPDIVLRWLATEVVAPIEAAAGVPRVVVHHGFHDPISYKAKRAGNYLASKRSEIRLTAAELRAFSGHLGHQHMPSPDHHWDPGFLPIGAILAALHPAPSNPQEAAAMGYLTPQIVAGETNAWPAGRWTFITATPDGQVEVFNDISRLGGKPSALHHGDMAGRKLNAPVIGLHQLVDTNGRMSGYVLLAADGGSFQFGAGRPAPSS